MKLICYYGYYPFISTTESTTQTIQDYCPNSQIDLYIVDDINPVYLPRCLKSLEDLQLDSADKRSGVEIVRKALRTPCSTIAKNAGADPSTVVEKVMAAPSPSDGYDALKDTYVDMLVEG